MTDYPFRDRFAEALDPELYTIEHLDFLLVSGFAFPFFGENATIVTEVRTYPTCAKVIHGLVAAGDLDEIVDVLIPRAEQWGKEAGCTMAIIESRPGWVRKLKGAGYAIHQTAVRKAL